MEEFSKEKLKVGLLVVAFIVAIGVTFFQSSLFEDELYVLSEQAEEQAKEQETKKDIDSLEDDKGTSAQGIESDQGSIIVHVVGAVKKPGILVLPKGSRVYQALELAEPTDKADMTSLNLALELNDGEQIYLLPKEANQASGGALTANRSSSTVQKAAKSSSSSPTSSRAGKININRASSEELEKLPGIGPALAERIVDYRAQTGPFQKGEDLLKVSGIGAKKYEDLKPFIVW